MLLDIEFLPYLTIYFIFVLVAEKTLKLNDQVLSQWPDRYWYQCALHIKLQTHHRLWFLIPPSHFPSPFFIQCLIYQQFNTWTTILILFSLDSVPQPQKLLFHADLINLILILSSTNISYIILMSRSGIYQTFSPEGTASSVLFFWLLTNCSV